MEFERFMSLLQMTISPVVMISGVGLLLLTISNRIARPIDRARALKAEIKKSGVQASEGDRIQLQVLLKRCNILRWSIGLLVFGILSAALMILFMIISAFAPIFLRIPIVVLLTTGVISIIASLILFLYDITLTLKALQIEVNQD